MADLQYYDIDGNPISLHALCRREPLWAANRIRTDQAEVAALRAERDALRALVLRMRTAMCAWSADEDGTVHGDGNEYVGVWLGDLKGSTAVPFLWCDDAQKVTRVIPAAEVNLQIGGGK